MIGSLWTRGIGDRPVLSNWSGAPGNLDTQSHKKAELVMNVNEDGAQPKAKRDTFGNASIIGVLCAYKNSGSHRGLVSY